MFPAPISYVKFSQIKKQNKNKTKIKNGHNTENIKMIIKKSNEKSKS